MNVLIVDDNDAAADLLRELLGLQDHTATCTYTAQQALDAAAAEDFDAALIDITLPDLPGTEVARRLRRDASGKNLLLVAVSGFGPGDIGDASTAALFDHHLQKPIDFEVLDRILELGACQMKASPGARSWIAAGVRHEVLTRAFPALRHDMATPVSVIRMALLLLKSQAAAQNFDAAAWKERTELIEAQLAALSAGMRSLRDWELAIDEESINRSALVTQCAALMRTSLELSGIALHVGPGLGPEADEPRFPSAAALRYMFLGALGYLHDSAPRPGEIHVEAAGADAVRIRATHGRSEASDAMGMAQRAPRSLAIDSIALQALADGLGYAIEVERDAVRFALSPAKED